VFRCCPNVKLFYDCCLVAASPDQFRLPHPVPAELMLIAFGCRAACLTDRYSLWALLILPVGPCSAPSSTDVVLYGFPAGCWAGLDSPPRGSVRRTSVELSPNFHRYGFWIFAFAGGARHPHDAGPFPPGHDEDRTSSASCCRHLGASWRSLFFLLGYGIRRGVREISASTDRVRGSVGSRPYKTCG